MFWPQPEKVVQGKEYPFPKKYQSLKKFQVFFGIKWILAKKTLFGWSWKRPFLRNSGPNQVRCHSGSFLWWPGQSHQVLLTTVQNKGHLYLWIDASPKWPKNGVSPKKWPIARKLKFFWGWSEWESCSPGYTCAMSCRQKSRSLYEKLTSEGPMGR